MTALEAALVIGNSICAQEIYEMDSLLAFLALVLGTNERHGEEPKSKVAYCYRRQRSSKNTKINGLHA